MPGVTVSLTDALDEVWENTGESQSVQNSNKCTPGKETPKTAKDTALEVTKLSAQVKTLNKRLTNLENNFQRAFSFVTRGSGIAIIDSDKPSVTTEEREPIISISSQAALAVIEHDLITSHPRNVDMCNKVSHFMVVLKKYNFALLQCFLMFVTAAVVISFGTVKFLEAHNSVQDSYKPFKVDGIDEYYRNEELRYKLPLHYFWFELAVVESEFYPIYNNTFQEMCNSTLKDCLYRYFIWYLNPFATLSPTMTPTMTPSISPTKIPTLIFAGLPAYAVDDDDDDVDPMEVDDFDIFQMVNDTTNGGPVRATCVMTTSSNGSVWTEAVGIRNFTVHIDTIGVNKQDDAVEIFSMLLRLELEDFIGPMSGKVMCDLNLEMYHIYEDFSEFAKFDILFMVSRDDYSSGIVGITEYIPSIKKVWRSQNDLIDQIYSYHFEENTYNGKSDIRAEAHLVDEWGDEEAMLNIEVYPFPTVKHYVSYDRYSYLDWLASIGGFNTLVIGFFFFCSSRIGKLANRREHFHMQQGILPALSLAHRNAEELAGLRSMTMAALGITEQEYFSGEETGECE